MITFAEYIDYLKQPENTACLYENYTTRFGPFPASFEECPFYTFLATFEPLSFKKPRGLSKSFNWKLLFSLIAASPECDYNLEFGKEGILPELLLYARLCTDDFEVATVSKMNIQQARALAFHCLDDLFVRLIKTPDGVFTYDWNKDAIGRRYFEYSRKADAHRHERHNRLVGKRGGRRKLQNPRRNSIDLDLFRESGTASE
jgi:hypothetical protein